MSYFGKFFKIDLEVSVPRRQRILDVSLQIHYKVIFSLKRQIWACRLAQNSRRDG